MNSEIKNNLRVAILVRQFPNIVQTYILNHIISLKNVGVDTVIIATANPRQAETHPEVNEYNLMDETMYINTGRANLLKQIFTLPLYKPNYFSAFLKILFSSIWKQYGLLYGIKALVTAKSLSSGVFDIAHSHTLISSYEYLYYKKIFNIPLVTTFHGFEPKSSKSLADKKVQLVLENVDAFVVNTVFARKQLTDLGCEKEKIHIIPQGTNIANFPYKQRIISKDKPIAILSVGRLSIEKGFHVAVKAIAKLVHLYPNIQYCIIGSGPEEQPLIRLIKDLEIQSFVKLHGPASTEALLSNYSDAHIFILPSIDFRDGSHTETQGVVLQEAQSSGIPVVASKTGGIPEIIHDKKTGLLFDEEDDEQLAQVLEKLISDKDLYNNLSEQARQDVEMNLSTEAISKRMLSLYKQVLQAN